VAYSHFTGVRWTDRALERAEVRSGPPRRGRRSVRLGEVAISTGQECSTLDASAAGSTGLAKY
jgi:hypothetical protein